MRTNVSAWRGCWVTPKSSLSAFSGWLPGVVPRMSRNDCTRTRARLAIRWFRSPYRWFECSNVNGGRTMFPGVWFEHGSEAFTMHQWQRNQEESTFTYKVHHAWRTKTCFFLPWTRRIAEAHSFILFPFALLRARHLNATTCFFPSFPIRG